MISLPLKIFPFFVLIYRRACRESVLLVVTRGDFRKFFPKMRCYHSKTDLNTENVYLGQSATIVDASIVGWINTPTSQVASLDVPELSFNYRKSSVDLRLGSAIVRLQVVLKSLEVLARYPLLLPCQFMQPSTVSDQRSSDLLKPLNVPKVIHLLHHYHSTPKMTNGKASFDTSDVIRPLELLPFRK